MEHKIRHRFQVPYDNGLLGHGSEVLAPFRHSPAASAKQDFRIECAFVDRMTVGAGAAGAHSPLDEIRVVQHYSSDECEKASDLAGGALVVGRNGFSEPSVDGNLPAWMDQRDTAAERVVVARSSD